MSVMLTRREAAMVEKKRSLKIGADVKPEVSMIGGGRDVIREAGLLDL